MLTVSPLRAEEKVFEGTDTLWRRRYSQCICIVASQVLRNSLRLLLIALTTTLIITPGIILIGGALRGLIRSRDIPGKFRDPFDAERNLQIDRLRRPLLLFRDVTVYGVP